MNPNRNKKQHRLHLLTPSVVPCILVLIVDGLTFSTQSFWNYGELARKIIMDSTPFLILYILNSWDFKNKSDKQNGTVALRICPQEITENTALVHATVPVLYILTLLILKSNIEDTQLWVQSTMIVYILYCAMMMTFYVPLWFVLSKEDSEHGKEKIGHFQGTGLAVNIWASIAMCLLYLLLALYKLLNPTKDVVGL